jgi:hypothetical protein
VISYLVSFFVLVLHSNTAKSCPAGLNPYRLRRSWYDPYYGLHYHSDIYLQN